MVFLVVALLGESWVVGSGVACVVECVVWRLETFVGFEEKGEYPGELALFGVIRFLSVFIALWECLDCGFSFLIGAMSTIQVSA